jgi:uncharacterized protein YlxW (UPF0749 family)
MDRSALGGEDVIVSARFSDAHALQQPALSEPVLEAPLGSVASLARRGRHRLRVHVERGTLGVTLVAIILGVYLAAQWQSTPRRAAAAPDRREVAAATIQRLEAEQTDLKKQIADLRTQLAQQQAQAATGESTLERLTSDLEREKLVAGTVALHGAGIKIVLDDSSVKTIPAKEDPTMYIVHEYQLRDVVNLLWSAGAEAISINGERVVEPTSIYCVGSTILVNDTRTSPPYEFLVVGDQARLESALSDQSNLKALKSRIKLYNLQFGVQRLRDVVVPAYAGSLDVRQAILGSSESALSTRGGGGR